MNNVWDFDYFFDVLDLRYMHLADLLLDNGDVDMLDDLMNLDRSWDMNVLVDNLDLWNFDNPFNVLDLWNMNMVDLFFMNNNRDMLDVFNNLNWAWYMNMLLDNLNMRNFYDFLHVLDLRNVDLYDLLFGDWHVDVPN